MNSRNSGRRLESFFAGRGFYIVLFLCASVIGVSAWMTAAGNKTMDAKNKSALGLDNTRIETVVLPPAAEEVKPVISADTSDTGEEAVLSEVWRQGDMTLPQTPEYVWPVTGELERGYCADELHYDVTLQDWRTHEAVDICADAGACVLAAHAGTVESIYEDGLYGTVLVISHGDGSAGVYANLDPAAAVSVGDWVNAGDIIGIVGTSALCEIGQGDHLHFAMMVNDEFVNPLDYLPA